MKRRHARSARQSPRHGHLKAQLYLHTHEQRMDLEETEFEEVLEENGEESLEPSDSHEEAREPNDLSFRDDSEPELDFSWQVDHSGDPRSHLLPIPPRVQWRVCMEENDALTVKRILGWRETSATSRRELILQLAAQHQRAFFLTGKTEKLEALTAAKLKADIRNGDYPQEIKNAYGGEGNSVSHDVSGQFFYAPWGALYSFKFLLQDKVCGVAFTRIYHALSEITAREGEDGNVLADKDIVARLQLMLPDCSVKTKDILSWRVRSNRPQSSMRLLFPKKDERREIYGKT